MKKSFLLLFIAICLSVIAKGQVTPAKKDSGVIIIDQPANGNDPTNSSALTNSNDPTVHDYTIDLAQTDTRFIFPGYTIKIHNYNVFDETNGFPPYNYNGDTSQVILTDTGATTTIRIKKDSIIVNDDPTRNLEKSIIEIIPLHKSDFFKLYFEYQIKLEEVVYKKSYDIDDTVPASSLSYKLADWNQNNEFKILTPTKRYFYSIPKSDDFFYEQPGGPVFNEVKALLHLKDKIVTDTIAHLRRNTLLYKNKPCVLDPQGICLRVDSYVKGKYKSTKYLLIEYGDYE